LVLPASIVPAAVVCSRLAFVATKLKSFFADDAPVIETVPFAVSETNTLPFPAFAIIFAVAVVNGEAVLVPTFPFRDVSESVPAFTVPVIWLFNRLLYDVRLTVPTGVVVFPIAPANDSVPLLAALVADSSTVDAALVFPASIVPAAVVANVLAFVATKLKSFFADDAPVIDTVPVAVSDMNALPFAAFAIMFDAAAVKGDAALVPMFPFADVRLKVWVFNAPVIVLLNRLAFDVKLIWLTGVVVLPIAPPTVNAPLFATLVADNSTVAAALVLPASIVPAAVVWSRLAFVATKLKSFFADDAPVMLTVPVAVSDMNALPFAAFAITFEAPAVNGDAALVPMLPFTEVKLSVWVFNAPVIVLLNRFAFDVRLIWLTGVVVLPIAPPTVKAPLFATLVADSSTVAAAFVLPASIVPAAVVWSSPAFVATKLKSFFADDAPVIETVPFAVSETNTLPFPAFAIIFAVDVVNGEAVLVPTLPFKDVSESVPALTVPVIWLFNRLL
jgi:hypothetical protein